MQSKKSSLVEILMNIGSGFFISLAVTAWLKDSGLIITLSSVAITGIFTVVSIARSYVWRRLFNKRLAKNA